MDKLIIRVQIVKLAIMKTFQFKQTDTIQHIINQVQDKVPNTIPEQDENFGIYLNDESSLMRSLWLVNSKTLQHYDITCGTVLQYQDKNRHSKVKMFDGSVKQVLIDDSKSVGQAVDIICENTELELIIRVQIVKLGIMKTFQFLQTDRIEKVINEVQEKVPNTCPKLNENYGVFLTDVSNPKDSHWLKNSKTLQFYDIKSGTILLYQDKNRFLKVKMLDGTIKTVSVDDSKSIGHALDMICVKLGIKNVDEYALFIEVEKEFLEEDEEPLKQEEKTSRKITVAKLINKVGEHQWKKEEQLRKKAHTDDDTNWLANDKTLREAGVLDDTLVVLSHRYTFERNVNITNPVEINLLYVQSRDSILDSRNPCSIEEAARFAAFQIQVVHGDYNESRYRSGYVDVKEFLPKEYLRNKEVIKKIKEEHSKIAGIQDLDAKYKYIQLCQNLPTYGVTFFLVKEKLKGKNKLIPILFGINKESCMRVDAKTKEILKMWPLTTVRRWAASPNSFTLDFGDYTEGMYMVQTHEGAQISQLLGGYIDLIMKQSKNQKLTNIQDDELGIIREDSIDPLKKNILQNSEGISVAEQKPNIHKSAHARTALSAQQQAFLTSLNACGKSGISLIDELDNDEEPIYAEVDKQPNSGHFDVDKSLADIAIVTAELAASVSYDEEEMDCTDVGASINTMSSNINILLRHLKWVVKRLDSSDKDSNDLLDAGQKLAEGFKDLVFTISPLEDKFDDDLNGVINKIRDGEAAIESLMKLPSKHDFYKETLTDLLEGISHSINLLCNHAKLVSDDLDEENVAKISKAIKNVKSKLTQLEISTDLLAPYMYYPLAEQHMVEAVASTVKNINTLAGLCVVTTDNDDLCSKVRLATQMVTHTLNIFLQQIHDTDVPQSPHNVKLIVAEDEIQKTSEKRQEEEKPLEMPTVDIYNMLLHANDKLVQSAGSPNEMVKQATTLGQVVTLLIKELQGQANALEDDENRDRLFDAARTLSKATADLLSVAKVVKEHPFDKDEQEKLNTCALFLRLAINDATNNALKKACLARLENSAKQAVATTSKVILLATNAAPHNTNPVSQQQFSEASTAFSPYAKDLVDAVKGLESKSESTTSKSNMISSAKSFVPIGLRIVASSKTIAPTFQDNDAAKELSEATLEAEKALNYLRFAVEQGVDDNEEYDQASNAISQIINDLDQASLSAISRTLKPVRTEAIKGMDEKICKICEQLKNEIPNTVTYAKGVPEKISFSVIKLVNLIEPLAGHVISFASNLSSRLEQQIEILDLTKTVLESAAQLVIETKNAGGNPKTTDNHTAVDEAANNMKKALKDLMECTKATTGEIDAIVNVVSSFANIKLALLKEVDDDESAEKTFVEYQDNMVNALKAIARDSHDLVGKAHTKPMELGKVCEHLYLNYKKLVEDTRYAVLMSKKEIGEGLKTNVETLGDVCACLIQSAGDFQLTPNDDDAKKELADKAKDVCVMVARVMTCLQRGSVGTQACINAVSTLSGLIGDIDTTVMFAQMGMLDCEDGTKFIEYREEILLAAQKLVHTVKSLVSSTYGVQDLLAACIKEVSKSTTNLVDNVKLGASTLGSDDMNGQILLLNAVKDVTLALSDLINSAKTASGNPTDEAASVHLKSTAKHMVGNLSSLLKTVRSVENETSCSDHAIESSIEAIRQAIMALHPDETVKKATPEDLIRATIGITLATAKTVAAGNSVRQADIVEAANLGRRQCCELMEMAQGAITNTDSEEVKVAVIIKVGETSQAYCEVLRHVSSVVIRPSPQMKQHLNVLSKNVAVNVGQLVKVAEELKGSDLVNPEDPNVIAENELLGAAASIEAAARKLAELKPRERPKEADETLNFEEQILEAAKSITAAAGALVKAATVTQRELVADGMVSTVGTDPYADTRWSQGLISAARLVAEATGSLCEAANAAILGNASQEKLIASAQAVSSSTAQLLLACRVKARLTSKAQKGLQAAGSAVKHASDSLVKAAQESAAFELDEVDSYLPHRGEKTGLLISEIEAQEAILIKQRELDSARRKLEQIRSAKYKREPTAEALEEEQA